MAESMDVDTTEGPTLRQDLTCPLCYKIYCDPVLLPCSHSFCRECLEANRRFNKKCPLCRTEAKPGKEVTNLALKNACETYVKFADPTLTETTTPEDTCKMHRKPLTLYCVKDEEPICVDCVSLHTTHEHTHKLLGIEEGANVAKKELGLKIEIFERKVESYTTLTPQLDKTIEYIKSQAGQAEVQIKAEFESLRLMLADLEASRLKALASEEEQKLSAVQQLIGKTNNDIIGLKRLTESVKREMGNEDLALLQNFQKLKRKAQWTREECSLPNDSLLDMGKHVGGLSFKIWKSMQPHIKFNSVVLDPNTASPWLRLSPDLTTVEPSPELLTLPDNPERFDPCIFLLGAEGYTSGKHRWDFKVGGNTTWIVGVCKESVVRKQKFTISTKRGVWCIGLSKGVYTVYTPERTELQVQHFPKSIRIKLNMDKGEVSFWDAETASHLVTLKHDFDEKMFPFFGPGLQSTPMILSEGKVSIHTS